MTADTHPSPARRTIPWRLIGWGTAGLLLLLPLVAGAPWTISDYIFAAVLFGGVGLAFEFIVRKSGDLAYRFGAATAVIAAFLTVWVNAAVGMIGDGSYNLLFAGVLLVALGGSILARFRAVGMARAMLAAAALQTILSAFGYATDPHGATLSLLFAGPWLLSAALFWNASKSGEAS